MAVSWHGLLDASVDIEAPLLRHPELTPLQRDTLIKPAEDADPRLENSFETLGVPQGSVEPFLCHSSTSS